MLISNTAAAILQQYSDQGQSLKSSSEYCHAKNVSTMHAALIKTPLRENGRNATPPGTTIRLSTAITRYYFLISVDMLMQHQAFRLFRQCPIQPDYKMIS